MFSKMPQRSADANRSIKFQLVTRRELPERRDQKYQATSSVERVATGKEQAASLISDYLRVSKSA